MPVERENFRNKIQFSCAQRLELICYKLIYTIFIRYVSWSSIKSREQLIMKDQNIYADCINELSAVPFR